MKVKGIVLALALSLLGVGCGGSSSSSGSLNIRTVMLVRGATAVTTTGSQSGNLGVGLLYPSFTSFIPYPTTVQTFSATDTGVTPNVALGTFRETSTVTNGLYTLYATGVEGGTGSLAPTLTLVPETAPTANSAAATIRFANFSAAFNQSVDVYITPSGSTTPLSSQTPTFAAVPYGKVMTYVPVSGGAYTISVTPAGNSSTTLFPTSSAITWANGLDYTLYEADTSASAATVYSEQDTF